MAASAAALWQAGAQLLKVKLDDRLISERLIAIRQAAPEATLIVDANESWHSEGLAARCQLLADLGVAMLEQPLPALGGAKPSAYMDTMTGQKLVSNLLVQSQLGVFM